jgi:hypothetical protein
MKVFEELACHWGAQAEELAEGEANGNRESKKVCSSELFVHGAGGEILQRAV